MIKLKFQLDPKDAKQMLALSRFAGTLADVADISVKADAAPATKVEKPEAKVVELVSASGLNVGPESPKQLNEAVEADEAPKRTRRSRAQIEADEAAAKAENKKPKQETGEEAESEEAEVEGETEDAPAAKIEKAAGPAKRGSITLDDVRRAVAEKKGTAENFQKMKDELKSRYGVETTPKLDPKYYAEFYDFVNGLK